MRLRSLTHLVEVVAAIAHPKRITVLGSSALLASDPDLGEPGQPLELSLDADLLVEPCDQAQMGLLHEAVGEGSLFHHENGVYVDLMMPSVVSTLPEGKAAAGIAAPANAPARSAAHSAAGGLPRAKMAAAYVTIFANVST